MIRPQLEEFMRRMAPKSIAIIPGAREATRSNDTHYRFRQDSDFFYLTGFEEPESIAVIKHDQEPHYTLFVRPRDPEREIWDGRRAGVEGAKKNFGANESFPIIEFDEKLQSLLDGADTLYYRLGVNRDLDETIVREISRMRALNRKPIHPPQTIVDPATIIHEMRVLKSPDELELMQRAADIAAEAHVEAMKAARPGMQEYEVEALIERVFRQHGAAAPAYTSIVGAGANATVLHYINNDGVLGDGELLLIDAGAEYKGYASDITRTFPVNGRYTKPQREIYDLVLKAQMSCVEMVRPGTTHDQLKQHSIEVLTEGMVELGLLQGKPSELIKEKKYEKFYMHGLGHMLGIDVHDVGRYYYGAESRALEPGVVMTVEPGIYVSPDTKDVPSQYLGIGIRIEDDVLCTSNGPRVLTSKVPKQAEEIEELMGR
ncbi:MAG TPA: Xaa-Pro aminopeptidase [Pyrinomonadaceae bacterium]|jgi:Xaa-Pro aminopeptidase|nr:Xaa-Pro aminopeptidase [Pyrinomonadaceae bacterium]